MDFRSDFIGIGVTATDYFSTLMWILDSEKYLYYNSLENIYEILSPMVKDEFESWLNAAQRRIDIINEIIKHDDHIRP